MEAGQDHRTLCSDQPHVCRIFVSDLNNVDVNICVIPIVKSTWCTNVSNLFILEWHTTCFGRSFRQSSGVQDCTYSNRRLSNRHCCLLASGYPLASRQQYLFDKCPLASRQQYLFDKCPPASRQQYLFDKCLLLYVQSYTPDDGRKDRPKHVHFVSKINLVHWCI